MPSFVVAQWPSLAVWTRDISAIERQVMDAANTVLTIWILMKYLMTTFLTSNWHDISEHENLQNKQVEFYGHTHTYTHTLRRHKHQRQTLILTVTNQKELALNIARPIKPISPSGAMMWRWRWLTVWKGGQWKPSLAVSVAPPCVTKTSLASAVIFSTIKRRRNTS